MVMLGKRDFVVRLTITLATLICASLALSACGCDRFGCGFFAAGGEHGQRRENEGKFLHSASAPAMISMSSVVIAA